MRHCERTRGDGTCARRGAPGDLVAVMADNKISEEETLKKPFDYGNQPVHVAFLNKKLPCPHQFRSKNLIFFEESGLYHHMRAILRTKPSNGDTKAARSLLNKMHGNETSRCLKELFHLRSQVLLSMNF